MISNEQFVAQLNYQKKNQLAQGVERSRPWGSSGPLVGVGLTVVDRFQKEVEKQKMKFQKK